MSLEIVAVPIGHPDDITLRALNVLKEADLILGEEHREVFRLLRQYKIKKKRVELLNEHTSELDFAEILTLCHNHRVALVSDCGTPGFCDPGAQLVAACRKDGIDIKPIPGVSSLMTLLCVSGVDLSEFVFRGFLPTKKDQRQKALKKLTTQRHPLVLMDTPYRLTRLLEDLNQFFSQRKCLIGLNLTTPDEKILKDSPAELLKKLRGQKAEFVIIVL